MPQPPLTEFRRRVLLVDADAPWLEECAANLRERGYEVLTAHDGFEALQVLRGALPDLLICELDLRRMSGFELLSVVRTRFPQIAVAATSDEYTALNLPQGTIADAFVPKGPNAIFELLETVLGLANLSPIRPSKSKADVAPVWIPRSPTRYIILTCPECLRSFSANQPPPKADNPLSETCLSCGAEVRYNLSTTETLRPPEEPAPAARAEEVRDRTRIAITTSEEAVSSSRTLLEKHKSRR